MASPSAVTITSTSTRIKSRGLTRGRVSGPRANIPSSPTSSHGTDDRSSKKRKYVPGGPGGGGRYLEPDGSETPVGGTGPGGYAYSGPRGPIGRENMANGLGSPSPPPPTRSPAPASSPPAPAPPPTIRRRREPNAPTPRYSSAAAAAAAVVQGDGYKPREERGWEEIHPQLDIEAKFFVFSAEEVDGTKGAAEIATPNAQKMSTSQLNGHATDAASISAQSPTSAVNGDAGPATPKVDDDDGDGIVFSQPKRRRVGRPMRKPEPPPPSETVTPIPPKIVPPPGPNPREKLTLPQPTFRRVDPFRSFEQKSAGQIRYVDRSMANVGYQETDFYARPESQFIRFADGALEEDLDLVPGLKEDGEKNNTALGGAGVGRVEYDMDEQDDEWLAAYNDQRKSQEVEAITREVFEITMTKIEKEWYALEKRIPKPNPKPPQTQRPRSGSAAAVNGEAPGTAGEDQDSRCAICDDGDCENTNAIVFCDGCDLAVHQDCYGVPFIPEGQWLCRKCQLIGRGTPTCIFCPNTDGAFKQTNSSRWSHLLCAIWIPEVSLGNTTFMEPVMDVEKVPKQRWKLTCYICRQKMGACIQCSNKNCFVAFHVTCARRARLFLKMKSPHGGPAHADPSVLKAYCDKHVPADWRRENDVDAATTDAQEFYHHTMRGRIWADSQQSALALTSNVAPGSSLPPEERHPSITPRIHLTVGGNKRKSNQRARIVWKLPSGAPVIPQVVYNTVETSLQRFMIRKRKEYVAEACKYWTLKREARRGAALLKRLQLQMETFSSMEVTRRNYMGMGAAGHVRLQRRIDFATALFDDLQRLRQLCDDVKQRELEKLHEAELLKDVVDTVYCPISILLWPILERAQSLDGRGVFREGFNRVRSKLEARAYTTVATFSEDFGAAFSSVLGSEAVADMVPTKGTEGVPVTSNLTPEQKDLRRLAKRIIKSVQGSLEEAVRQEAELGGRPYEKELRELEMFLDHGILSRQGSIGLSLGEGSIDADAAHSIRSHPGTAGASLVNGHHPGGDGLPSVTNKGGESSTSVNGSVAPTQHSPPDPVSATSEAAPVVLNGISFGAAPHELPPDNQPNGTDIIATTETQATHHHQPGSGTVEEGVSTTPAAPASAHQAPSQQHKGPPTPPLSSTGDLLAPLSYGGIAWYMEPFDPIGTTIQDERWTGREVLRGMSEELSELDDEELKGLVDDEHMDTEMAVVATTEEVSGAAAVAAAAGDATEGVAAPIPPPKKTSKARARKKGGRRWR